MLRFEMWAPKSGPSLCSRALGYDLCLLYGIESLYKDPTQVRDSFLGCFKGGFKVSLGTDQWYRSSYGTHFDHSEIENPVKSKGASYYTQPYYTQPLYLFWNQGIFVVSLYKPDMGPALPEQGVTAGCSRNSLGISIRKAWIMYRAELLSLDKKRGCLVAQVVWFCSCGCGVSLLDRECWRYRVLWLPPTTGFIEFHVLWAHQKYWPELISVRV